MGIKKGVVLHLLSPQGVAKHPQLQNKEAHTRGVSIHLFTAVVVIKFWRNLEDYL